MKLRPSIKTERLLIYRFFIPSIVPLVFAVAAGFISYSQTLRVAEASIHERNGSVLENFRNTIDTHLKEIDSIAANVALDPQISRFFRVRLPLDTQEFALMRSTWRNLPPYNYTNELVYKYFIHFRINNIMMSSNSVHLHLDREYGTLLQYDDLTYEQWITQYFETYHNREVLAPTRIRELNGFSYVMPYLQSIPMGFSRDFSGTVLILLDIDVIRKLLPQTAAFQQSWVVIFDRNRNVILTAGEVDFNDPSEILMNFDRLGDLSSVGISDGGKKTVISYTSSAYNGWVYVAGAPRELILDRISEVKVLAIIVLVVSLGIGVVLAGVFSYRTSLPFQAIIKRLQKVPHGSDDVHTNGIDYIESRIGEIVERNDELRKRVLEQRPLMQGAFLSRLLRGEVVNPSEAESIASIVPMDLHAKEYICLAVVFEGYKDLTKKEVMIELNMTRVLVKENILKVFGSRCPSCEVDTYSLAVIVPIDNVGGVSSRTWIDERSRKIINDLGHNYSIPIRIGAGRAVTSLMDSYKSLHEAKEAIWLGLDSTQAVVWYSDLPSGHRGYYFPIETEKLLINKIRSGHRSQAKEVIDDVIAENFERRALNANMTRNLLFDMRGSFIKLYNQAIDTFSEETAQQVQQLIDDLNPRAPVCGFIPVSKQLVDVMANHFTDRKRSHNKRRIDAILSFIDDNYTDPNVSLSSIAEYFKLSETYLSQFFKEQTGENFVNYLSKRRLDEARRLLVESDMSIGNVSQTVGYQLPDTFTRAFRRQFGVSPSVFREEL